MESFLAVRKQASSNPYEVDDFRPWRRRSQVPFVCEGAAAYCDMALLDTILNIAVAVMRRRLSRSTIKSLFRKARGGHAESSRALIEQSPRTGQAALRRIGCSSVRRE